MISQPSNQTLSTSNAMKRPQSNHYSNYKKTLQDLEKLMDEVHHYNEKVQAEKATSHYLKLSRPTVSLEFDVS
jgi:hypothetical protein